jgi:uncharacterized protein
MSRSNLTLPSSPWPKYSPNLSSFIRDPVVVGLFERIFSTPSTAFLETLVMWKDELPLVLGLKTTKSPIAALYTWYSVLTALTLPTKESATNRSDTPASSDICLETSPTFNKSFPAWTIRDMNRSVSIPLLVIAVLLVAGVSVAAYEYYIAGTAYPSFIPTHFAVNGRTFEITSVATTETGREQGLMDRKITNSTFMLFIFPSPVAQPFWMYQTNSSLDIVWIESNGTTGHVVYIAAGAQPCPSLPCQNYVPTSPANYVIEAKAGFAASFGVQVGTNVTFS